MKLCLFCRHFLFINADLGYSDQTPGHDAQIGCLKNHYDINLFLDSRQEFREKILTAETCEDYDRIEE